MNHTEMIRIGWKHTWNNKFLWALGFLAALGSSSVYQYWNNYFTNGTTGMQMLPVVPDPQTGGLVLFGCLIFIVGIILWFISLSARGGLIGAVAQLETGSDYPDFRSAFRLGWSKAWRLVGMTIVLYIMPLALLVILVFGFIFVLGFVSYFVGYAEDLSAIVAGIDGMSIFLTCLILPTLLLQSLIYPFACRGIILRDMDIRESLRHGWAVLKENLGEIFILVLAFSFIYGLVGSVTLAALIPVIPMIRTASQPLFNLNLVVLQWLMGIFGLLVALAIMSLLSAVFVAWRSATFTVAYLHWTGKGDAVE